MNDSEKFQAIRNNQIGCGLSQDQIQRICDSAEWVEFRSGDKVFSQDDAGDRLLLVVEGRVRITVQSGDNESQFVDYRSAGEHFGEISLLTGEPRATNAIASMDTKLLCVSQSSFQDLLARVPGFAANVSRSLGYRLRRETTGEPSRGAARVIGLINPTLDSYSKKLSGRLTSQLADALSADGGEVHIIVDRVPSNQDFGKARVSEIPRNMSREAKSDWVRRELSTGTDAEQFTLIWLSETTPEAEQILLQCEQILWLSIPRELRNTRPLLFDMLRSEPGLHKKIHWGWMLREGYEPGNIPPLPVKLEQPDFKIVLSNSIRSSRLERMSISRLVRFVRKTRLGLALGGGAARGMAHLGVLKAFENEGIYFDVIAGTSAGALVGVPYALGMTPDEATDAFRQDLSPGWLFSRIPKGKEWYMLYQFRMGKWDALLRKRIGNVKLEQLLTPMHTVTADLIAGRQVIRDRGDATHAILESINLPNIAKPIMRDGMALVDGGILNNIPSDILPERGADFVVGVDIAAQMARQFGKNSQATPSNRMRSPSQLQTIIRSNEIQDRQITALRTREVDQMIVVDTSMFDFADFTRSPEMSRVGEEAATRAMPELKKLLARLQTTGSSAHARFICPNSVSRPRHQGE